jgi:hypothetical protein
VTSWSCHHLHDNLECVVSCKVFLFVLSAVKPRNQVRAWVFGSQTRSWFEIIVLSFRLSLAFSCMCNFTSWHHSDCRKDMKRPLCKVSCAVSIVSAVQSETAETARSRENWAPSGWQSSLMRRSPATLEPLNPALHKQTAVKFGCFWWRRLLQRCTVAMTSWRALCFKQLLYA